jgi:hypothetical protein
MEQERDGAVRCSAWLGRDGECCVPHRLLHEAEQNRKRDGQQGDADGNPRANGVWTTEPPLQLMLTEQAISMTHVVIPTANPLAQLVVRLFAKLMGVRFFIHDVCDTRSNASGDWR